MFGRDEKGGRAFTNWTIDNTAIMNEYCKGQ